MPRPCQVLRVFTRGDEGGNHLGVVNDCADLETSAMQEIATDLSFSETVFVEWAANETPYVRIFTPVDELPFAGHPLVGTAWVMTSMAPGDLDTLRCGIGDVRFYMDGEIVWVDAPMSGKVGDAPDAGDISTRARLPSATRSWWVKLPLPYLLLEYATVDEVASANPHMDALSGHFGTYIFSRDGSQVRARFFAPASGVPEDPATGSAAVALATALASSGEPSGEVTIDQGEEMGNPSRIQLRWLDTTASIGGTVVRDEMRILDA